MPLSLLYLSGTTKSIVTTHILDLNVAKKKHYNIVNAGDFSYVDVVEKEIGRLMPDYVGVTCLFSGQIEMVC